MTASFNTLKSPGRFEDEPTKGSRFLSEAQGISTAEEAMAFIKEVQLRHPGANHHCWAYVLADESCRSNDDGEPGGSAGRPILAQINGHDLRNIVVVVIRYFGGTKLGVGGLMRAYGGCAGRQLDRLETIEIVEMTELRLRLSYADSELISKTLASVVTLSTDYTEEIQLSVEMPKTKAEKFRKEVTDITSGRAEFMK